MGACYSIFLLDSGRLIKRNSASPFECALQSRDAQRSLPFRVRLRACVRVRVWARLWPFFLFLHRSLFAHAYKLFFLVVDTYPTRPYDGLRSLDGPVSLPSRVVGMHGGLFRVVLQNLGCQLLSWYVRAFHFLSAVAHKTAPSRPPKPRTWTIFPNSVEISRNNCYLPTLVG